MHPVWQWGFCHDLHNTGLSWNSIMLVPFRARDVFCILAGLLWKLGPTSIKCSLSFKRFCVLACACISHYIWRVTCYFLSLEITLNTVLWIVSTVLGLGLMLLGCKGLIVDCEGTARASLNWIMMKNCYISPHQYPDASRWAVGMVLTHLTRLWCRLMTLGHSVVAMTCICLCLTWADKALRLLSWWLG